MTSQRVENANSKGLRGVGILNKTCKTFKTCRLKEPHSIRLEGECYGEVDFNKLSVDVVQEFGEFGCFAGYEYDVVFLECEGWFGVHDVFVVAFDSHDEAFGFFAYA